MKNLNMVRKIHNVSRTVRFVNQEEALLFIALYSDLFYHAQSKDAWNREGYRMISPYEVKFTMKKSTFESIIKDLQLKKIDNNTYEYVS